MAIPALRAVWRYVGRHAFLEARELEASLLLVLLFGTLIAMSDGQPAKWTHDATDHKCGSQIGVELVHRDH